MPLFYAAPAKADTLQNAQSALAAGQQELETATLDKLDADALVASASQDVIDATANLATAQTAYNASMVFYPATTAYSLQNVVLNGTFDSASNWSNIGMGTDYTMTNSNIARVYNGILIGSYTYGTYIQQVGTLAAGVRQVTFSYDMSNNNFNGGQGTNGDQYRVEFRTYAADGTRLNYYNTGDRNNTFGWTHFSATYSLAQDAVRWDIGFRMSDTGYWNGNFAGSVDNVSLIANVGTTTLAYSTYGQAETVALANAQLAMTNANSNYAQAIAIQNQAAVRLQAATASIPGLQLAVADAQAAIDAQIAANAETARLAAEAQAAADLAAQQAALAQAEADRIATEQAAQAAAAAQAAEEARLAAEAAANAIPPWWAQQNYEGDSVVITAPEGWVFFSVRAWYGSPTDSNCGADVSSILTPIMVGQHSVTLNLDNGTFGDPCGGVVKVTRFTWSVVPAPQVIVTPDPTPVVESTPTPTPTETPVIIVPIPVPTVEPTKEPVVVPTPEPTVDPTPTTAPTQEPTPTPTQTTQPTPEPTKDVIQPSPTPEPSKTPEVQPEPQLPITEKAATEAIATLVDVAPEDLTDKQVAALVAAANVVFETAEQGSPAYTQALAALAVAAQADDPQLPAELAAVPGAAQVLAAFNALGNVGADMAPATREEAKKEVLATVVATGAAINATVGAATSAAASAASTASSGTSSGSSGSSSGSSGGSSGSSSGESSTESKSGSSARRKEK